MPRVLVPFAGVIKTARRAGRRSAMVVAGLFSAVAASGVQALLAAGLLSACGGEEAANSRPLLGNYDFVFVSIDTLRADHLSSYGYSRATDGDPASQWSLAWLAEQGQQYQTCWAPIGKTMPSLASFWTGLFPLEHGAISNPTFLAPEVRHFAEVFKQEGYQNHAMLANRALDHALGLSQGFDSYDIRARELEGDLGSDLLKRADPAIANGEKLMLWAHWMSPHQPYTPPAELAAEFTARTEPVANNQLLYGLHRNPEELTPELKQYLIDLYDAEVLLASQRLQSFLSQLDQKYRDAGRGGLLENAVIVFFSDHGEELADRNAYFLHAKSLYSGVLQVPLFVIAPGLKAGKVEAPIALQEVLPWLLEGKEPQGRAFAASWQTGFYAWRRDHWTLIQNPGRSQLGPLEPPDDVAYVYPYVALYDRRNDPLEQKNIAELHPEIVKELLAEQWQWFQQLQRREAKFVPGMDMESQRQKLIDLGYADVVPDVFVNPVKPEEWADHD